MSFPARGASAFALLLALAAPAFAQSGYYDARFGQAVDVTLDDLLQNPESYDGRAVRTKGRLDFSAADARTYVMKGSFFGAALIQPVPNVQVEWESRARQWVGETIEITGVVQVLNQTATTTPQDQLVAAITFWSYVGPEEDLGDKPLPPGSEMTLEQLVTNPGRRDGQLVRVVGQFRGANLFGDLPVRSRADSDDWVIKDDVFAVWVTGRKPRGRGWELDRSMKRDTGKWIEVVGKPETRRGVVYIRAQRVALTGPPSATARVEPPPPPPPRPRVPPVVVFSLPLDGEAEVPSDSRFTVQFSKDMDKASFEKRVLLRYAGAPQPGDRAFDGARLTYDDGRRALTVDPGDVLRPGRVVELVLLAGILDTDGMTLVPRNAGRVFSGETIDVLRYRTAY
jgi:hypothetical protein